MNKQCTSCGERKPANRFYVNDKASGRLTSRCKQCIRTQARLYRSRNLEQGRKYAKRYREKFPDKVQASVKRTRKKYRSRTISMGPIYRAVRKAKENGSLTVGCCETCGLSPGVGTNGRERIHAHHDDYSKPLEVRWFCVRCHKLHHRRLRNPEFYAGQQ